MRDEAAFEQLDSAGQLVLRFGPSEQATSSEQSGDAYNPNGSMGDVAGMCDKTGRVFGLMPHPERFIDPTQHPQWTRLPEQPEGAGFADFPQCGALFFLSGC